jgi:copper chaperone
MSETSTYNVTGMSCSHCAQAVTSEVSDLPGVTDVDVDLESGQVRVVSDAPIDDDAFRAAVAEAGYEVDS